MQIIKDVYQLCGSPYGLARAVSNCYAVKGQDSVILIDSGVDENQLNIIDANMKYWGLDKFPVSHLLITHSHFDHSGNAHVFKERGAVVYAGPGDAEGIEKGDDRTIGYAFNRTFPVCKVDTVLKDGDVIQAGGLEFKVIHMPGHTAGSLIFSIEMEGRLIFFTGDVINISAECDEALLGWNGSVDYDKAAYFQSITKIKDMEPDIILGGHFDNCLIDSGRIIKNAYLKALLELR